MSQVLVRYRLKAERLVEHEALIAEVFKALERDKPEGLRYRVMKEPDGVSFLHLAVIDTPDGVNPLQKLPEFKAFTANVKDRCEIPPNTVEVTQLAAYRF